MKRKRELSVRLKRAYEPPQRTDGCRILIDGLWPRGISKEAAALDAWVKEVAPSPELRAWFGHDPAKWTLFKKKYSAELATREADIQAMLATCRQKTLTLVFAARDSEHSNAVVLKEFLEKHFTTPRERPEPKPRLRATRASTRTRRSGTVSRRRSHAP